MLFTIQSAIQQINKEIEKFEFGVAPANLYDPIKYIMALGGKRLRPMLTLMSYNLFDEDLKKIMLPAIGVEVFHNFTLLHDDIMDNAPLRRGKPTVHEKWNQNVAILSGDVMLVKAYDLLLNLEDKYYKQILKSFNVCAASVCEGQQFDVDFETSDNVFLEDYINMITLKTAVLLGFSLELGAVAGGAEQADVDHLVKFGINIGIAFQLQDDLLDIYGDKIKFGKETGGDIIAKKKTFLLLNSIALAKGDDQDFLKKFLSSKDIATNTQVEQIKKIYDNVGVYEMTKKAMNDYFEIALKSLKKVNAPLHKKKILKEFVTKLMLRES